MISTTEAVLNVANATSPYKKQRPLSIAKLVIACEKRNADIHEVLALALSTEARELSNLTGMTLLEQARIARDILLKSEPSLQAVKHSGDSDEPLLIRFSRDDEEL